MFVFSKDRPPKLQRATDFGQEIEPLGPPNPRLTVANAALVVPGRHGADAVQVPASVPPLQSFCQPHAGRYCKSPEAERRLKRERAAQKAWTVLRLTRAQPDVDSKRQQKPPLPRVRPGNRDEQGSPRLSDSESRPRGSAERRTERRHLLFDRQTHKLLGVHALGQRATEIIHIGQAVLFYGGSPTTQSWSARD
jgi:hypothetical protein